MAQKEIQLGSFEYAANFVVQINAEQHKRQYFDLQQLTFGNIQALIGDRIRNACRRLDIDARHRWSPPPD
jgi:hypothetical protein